MSEVSVVTVLFNSAQVIEACLASIPATAEVIVVDNHSADHGRERALRARPDATVVRSERNLGFGGGCNLGWRRASGRYIAFVNPDVRLRAGALDALIRRLEQEPHGIVGPAMLDATGTARRLKLPASLVTDCFALLPAAARWAASRDGRLPAGGELHEKGGRVWHVEGACFVVRRADLETIGGFDEDLFLYDEEESLALRLLALGGHAVYEPAAAVEHIGAHSTEQVSALATRHMYRSRALLYRKRDGDVRGRLAAAALGVAALLSLPVAMLNSTLGRPRTLTLSHVANVLHGLAIGARDVPRSSVSYPRRPSSG